MTKNPRVGVWFAASAALFLARSFLFSTWLSRGPEVQTALHLDEAQMGFFVMLYPVGGLLGILFASTWTNRFGSGPLTIAGFSLGALSLAGLAFTVPAGNVSFSSILLVTMGLPMAIADFLGNYEGTAVDRQSTRALLPMIHAAWGVGMMAAAAFTSYLASAGIGLTANYLIISVLVAVPAIWAGFVFPKRAAEKVSAADKKEHALVSRKVWTEKRTLLIALIGFSFIMAEISAGTWVPIALTQSGISASTAALAFSMFWVVITITRVIGSEFIERVGRHRIILLSAVTAAAGVAVFMLDSVLHLPYLGLVLWGIGIALGFPMSVSAMGDEAAKSSARINMIITVVYISSISVGPALGAVGKQFGIYFAFSIPLALMIVSALLSKVTKRVN